MTTLNTIIEEEKVKMNHKYDLRYFDGSTYAVTEEFEKDLTTAMQRAYEAGQSEERAKIREEMDKCDSCAFNPCEKHKPLTQDKTTEV